MLIVVYGLPGTGKSTIANIIAKKVNGIVLNTDVIRKKLFLRPTYERWEKTLVYKVMYLLTDYLLKTKSNCILDAVFTKELHKKVAKELAENNKTSIYFIECICDESVIRQRMERRAKSKGISDANFDVYLELKKEREPTRMKHFILDTTDDIAEVTNAFLDHTKLV
jgi:hypothetical protein